MDNAGETLSDARMETSEGPRATGTSRPGGLAYGQEIETGRSLLRRKRNLSGSHETIWTTTSYETPSLK